jgi:hypothetical protein
MNFSISILVLSLLITATAEPLKFTKDVPVSEAQLLEKFTIAAKSKNEDAIRLLICWDGPVVIEGKVDAQVSELLSRKGLSKINMHPLSPGTSLTNLFNGYRFYPNIPVIGQIDVWFAKNQNILRFYYGQKADGFYVSRTIKERVLTPEKSKTSL